MAPRDRKHLARIANYQVGMVDIHILAHDDMAQQERRALTVEAVTGSVLFLRAQVDTATEFLTVRVPVVLVLGLEEAVLANRLHIGPAACAVPSPGGIESSIVGCVECLQNITKSFQMDRGKQVIKQRLMVRHAPLGERIQALLQEICTLPFA